MYTEAASRTEALYDQHSNLWVRSEPTILSDYTARPRVLEALGEVTGLSILDIGCGEGYMARKLASAGASRISGIDLSTGMVDAARAQNTLDQYPIDYEVQDLRHWSVPHDAYDRVIAVFLFNYMTVEHSTEILAKCAKALKPGGELVLTLPHPSLPWIREPEAPFYFDRPTVPYHDARNHELSGRIWQRNGDSVPVQCFHKTFEDIMSMVAEAGFDLVDFNELYVTQEHLSLDPGFFSPLQGTPLHVLIHARVAK